VPEFQQSTLHCSSEFHLARMKSTLAPLVYSLALRLSKRSGVFSASLVTLADYFGHDYSTVWRAVQELVTAGFFDLISAESFQHSTYRVIKHEEWAKANPGSCCEKIAFPGEGDKLGVDLYAVCGGRVKFFPNQLKALRSTGLADDAILGHWKAFLEADEMLFVGERAWRAKFYHFLNLLRASSKEAA
jgi:hypothetical protein